MITMSKSFVGRALLGAVALAGVAAAVPATARPYDGYGRPGWGHERVIVERGYRPVVYGGYYAPAWRAAPIYVPAPVVVWHGHYGHYGHYGRW